LNKNIEEQQNSFSNKEEEYKLEISKLEKGKDDLQAKILEIEKEKDTLESCLKENSDTKILLDEKDEMIQALKNSISMKVQQAEEVKNSEIHQLKQEIEEVSSEKLKIFGEFKNLEEKYEEDLKNKNEQIKELDASRAELKESIDKKENEFFKLTEEKQSLESKIESDKNTISNKDELIQNLKERLEITQDTAKDLEIRNKNLEEASQQDAEEINKELTIYKADNEILKNKMSDLVKEKEKESERNNTKLEAVRADLKVKSEENAKLDAENSEVKRQNTELTEKVDELKRKINDLKVKTDRQVRLSTIAMMNVQKNIAKKVARPVIEGNDDLDEITEGIVTGPFTRKSTIIKKKIKFNNQIIDPSIMDKQDWELTATEKYQKSILEHYKNLKYHERRTKGGNYRDINMEEYGKDIIDAKDLDEDDDKEEGVTTS